MDVIVNKCHKTDTVECLWCESILRVEEKDYKTDYCGDRYFICPCCNERNYRI
jgi:hypothetical protein